MNRFKLYPIGNCDPLSQLKTLSNLGYKYVSGRKVEEEQKTEKSEVRKS